MGRIVSREVCLFNGMVRFGPDHCGQEEFLIWVTTDEKVISSGNRSSRMST
jgi:hypothetical protein